MSPLGLAAEECSCGKDLKQMKVDVQCIQVERLFLHGRLDFRCSTLAVMKELCAVIFFVGLWIVCKASTMQDRFRVTSIVGTFIGSALLRDWVHCTLEMVVRQLRLGLAWGYVGWG